MGLCMFGFSFGQNIEEVSSFDEVIQTVVDDIDAMLLWFFFEIGAQIQTSVETHSNTYLSTYCTPLDVFDNETEDTLDCGSYQTMARALDTVIESIVPDLESAVSFDLDEETSLEEVQIVIEQTELQVIDEIAKLDRLFVLMTKALQRPWLTDKQQFGIRYILFSLATMKDIIGLLPDFLENMIDYTTDISEWFETLDTTTS